VGSVLLALSGSEFAISPEVVSQSEQQTDQTALVEDLSPDSVAYQPDETAAEDPIPESAEEPIAARMDEPNDTADDDTADDVDENDVEDDDVEDDAAFDEARAAEEDESAETTPEEDTATAAIDEPALNRTRPTPHGPSAAVDYALDQVGKPYEWGGTGPRGFDCSGLVMKAWQAGGVELPHFAADQWRYGHQISRDELRAGDLIFLYGLGHVQLYTGNGMVVHAPTPGSTVRVVSLPTQGIDGYRRLTTPDVDDDADINTRSRLPRRNGSSTGRESDIVATPIIRRGHVSQSSSAVHISP
jgi:cell wall-associated NlpC family hydrolase